MMSRRLLLIVASLFALVNGQQQPEDYGDYNQNYSEDGLYADYARQQQAKDVVGKA